MTHRRPIQRTRQYAIWAEKVGPVREDSPYQLVFQLVEEDDSGLEMIRAAYRKDGRLRPRPPVYPAQDWTEVISAAVLDPTFFDDEQVEQIAEACAERQGREA